MHPFTQRMGDLSGSVYGNYYYGIIQDDDCDKSLEDIGLVGEGGEGMIETGDPP